LNRLSIETVIDMREARSASGEELSSGGMKTVSSARRLLLTVFIIALMVGWPLFAISIVPQAAPSPDPIHAGTSYVSHAPISIGSNADFTSANGVTGGMGTAANPYIIEGWDINASTAWGIDIENVDAYFIVRGCYIHDGASNYDGIDLVSCVNGVLDSNNCTNNYDGIYVESSSDIIVMNNSCNSNEMNGIDVEYSSSIVIEDNECSYPNTGSGIYLYSSSDSTVNGNNCSYSASSDGIDLDISCSNNIISGNVCNWNYWGGIWLNDSDNNNIDSNDCYHSNLGAGVELDNSSFNVITNNNCSYSANDDGINLWLSCDNNTISRNNCSWNYWDGIWLDFSDNNTISYNDCSNSSLSLASVGAGVELDNSSGNIVFGNDCSYSAYGDGIDLWISCSNNTIIGNNCSWNSYAGIWLDASSNNTISGNNCSNNVFEGIELDASSNCNTITGNLCEWNANNGIYLWTSCNNNTVSRNNCSWNANDGIFIEISSDGNELFFNQLFGNTQYGMEIRTSSNNLVWNNTFLGNKGAGTAYSPAHVQAHNTVTANFWNTTGGIGNYWSDWQGRDFNSDGIQDAPYNTSGNANAQDFYPLAVIPDSTPPTTTAVLTGTLGTNGWYTSDVTVNLTAADNVGGTGLDATYYRIGTSGSWTVFSSPFIVSTEGTTAVQFYSRDNASNDESVKSVLIDIDLTPPDTTCNASGTLGANGWHTSAVNVLLLPSDPAPGSGINYTMYRIDTGSWTTYTTPFDVSADGSHLVEFYSVDNASNVESTNSTSFKIDATPPSGTIEIQGGVAYINETQVNLTLLASDVTSGVEKFRCSNDQITWGSWESWQNLSDSFSWNLEVGDGNKTVFFQIMDNASNVLTCNATITLDTTPPVVSFELTSGAELDSSTATINWSAADANGIGLFEYSLDGGAFTPCGNETHVDLSDLTDGSHNLTVRAIDVAGNSADGVLLFKVTTTAPFSIGGLLPMLAIIVAAVVAALLIIILLMRRRKGEEEKAEPATAPAATVVASPVIAKVAEVPTQAAPRPTCPKCGRELVWLEKYQKFNCYSCQAFYRPDEVKPPTNP
jgi:parallel beta-helix repeat protein